jgi:D-psicose/D-tagatose/L-ribulose 3-epimerase
MKIGINTWVWVAPLTTAAFERLLPHVAGMGFDWIEVPLETIGDLDYAHARTLLDEYGLGISTCAAIGPDRDFIHPEAAIRANANAYLREAIAATAALGAQNLIGPIYAAVGRVWSMSAAERERDTELLAGQLRELGEHAANHGVTLCIEPLNRFETSFLNLAEQGIALVDRVAHPAVQLMLDTFHMNIEERSLGAAIRAAGPRLRHVHACENDRGAPGSGHVPWHEVVAALHEIGYSGPLVIESFTSDVKSIARAAAIWRPLAASQDALASEGLAFLRSLVK